MYEKLAHSFSRVSFDIKFVTHGEAGEAELLVNATKPNPRLSRVSCQNVHRSFHTFIQRLGLRNKQTLSPGFDQLTLNSSRENIRDLSVCGNIIKLRQRDAQHYTNLQLLVKRLRLGRVRQIPFLTNAPQSISIVFVLMLVVVVCTLNPDFENVSLGETHKPVLFKINSTAFEKCRNL